VNRRLALAYAWGKWFALRADNYHKAMEFYKNQRPRKNWAILVEQDEMALRYQRCGFRIERAMRAVGAWGLIGYASLMEGSDNVRIMGVDFPAKVAAQDEVDRMNADQFQRNQRDRAMKAKAVAEDKRHPLACFEDICAEAEAEAYEKELRGNW
jgi:hypothetical protein